MCMHTPWESIWIQVPQIYLHIAQFSFTATKTLLIYMCDLKFSSSIILSSLLNPRAKHFASCLFCWWGDDLQISKFNKRADFTPKEIFG